MNDPGRSVCGNTTTILAIRIWKINLKILSDTGILPIYVVWDTLIYDYQF